MAEAAHNSQPAGKRLLRWAALGLTMLVAACASGPRIVPAPERPPVVEAPKPKPVEKPISAALPQDFERHRIALLVPLSGPNAGVGRSLQNATQLAILDTKTDAIRVTSYDTAGPGGAAAAAQQAIGDGNRLILGPLLSEEARDVAPIARRARIPVLSFSNDSSVAGDGTYLLGYMPSQSIERVVDFASRNGVTQFAGLLPAGLYGERTSTAFLRAVERSGGQVVAIATFDGKPGSITAAVTKLGKQPFQAILLATSPGTAAVAIPLVRKTPGGKTARPLGTDQWNLDSGVGANAALDGAWFASVPNTLYRHYAAEYRGRFGAAPYRLSTMGYDAVLLTVRIARDWRPGDVFPEQRLIAPDGFGGIDGAFRFGRDGIAERALEVQEVKGGVTTTISPAPAKFGD